MQVKGWRTVHQVVISPALKRILGAVLISSEALTREIAQQKQILAAGEAGAVAFGNPFIANPALPRRRLLSAELNRYSRKSLCDHVMPDVTVGYTGDPNWRTSRERVAQAGSARPHRTN